VSNLRAAIDQAEANRYSPLIMRQAPMAWVVLSGKQGDFSSGMIAIAVSGGTTHVGRHGARNLARLLDKDLSG